ncbi:YeeE/YedE family protein [Propylenella binzhouense]|uniref:YeeE/YedE family protein n=1 Tax=Propylenella binzhouense TaxID=2555902 RepID=A0A964T701_9HYPH|nr:YeeE/YedE thiosulfate transporter family protein [Propylenella binzhouense]MYZ49270.1 YeeE/YedE family protein [Propylenella binzhouense]
MTEFTPIGSTAGGMLIGLSAVLLMLFMGRIAGISGILSRLLPPAAPDWGWRAAFIAGMAAAPLLAWAVTGAPPVQAVSGDFVLMAVAGLLVGFGSVFGNGCTSGHGVCGLSRLSARALTATLVFMATAIVTVFVARHVIGG